MTWDPGQYLRFATPRRRPALDLLARVAHPGPRHVADLGCGTGAVTRILAERWPQAEVVGMDSSVEMLAAARRDHPGIRWEVADIATWAPAQPCDVVFSNAALHWLDDHDRLMPRLVRSVSPGGVLTIQMPRNHDAPSHTVATTVARAGPWRDRLSPLLRPAPVSAPEVYHDLLAPIAAELDIWETVYLHRLSGPEPVAEWVKGSLLRPLLAALDPADARRFETEYRQRVAEAYPPAADGTTLFPFRRLFIVAVAAR